VAGAADERPFPVRVNEAVDRSAANLVDRQAADGSWNKEDKVHPIGRTALCTYALLHAGYDKDDPPVRKALTFLGVADGYATPVMPISTYEAGCFLMLLHALGPEQDGNIHKIADWLVENFNASAGLWGYPDGIADLSNTQYAAMGLKVAALHGHKTPERVWKRVIASTLSLQAESGAFRYRGQDMYRGSMTHAALLCLRFAHEGLGERPEKKTRAAMKRAQEWLDETYRVDANPWGRGHSSNRVYYYLYGLERYAVIFGIDKMGDGRDWYREGAEELLALRKKNWSWGGFEQTAFAILFLRKVALTQPTARARGESDAEQQEFVEAVREKPAAGIPTVVEWLVAGPFRGKKGEDDSLLVDHVKIARAKPLHGAKAGKARWEKRVADPADEGRLDLGNIAWSSHYCAVWVISETEQDALLWMGGNDGMRGWWNGVALPDMHHHDTEKLDRHRTPVRLEEVRNLLIVQVENLQYRTHIAAVLTTTDGTALPDGVRVTTEPRR